jgi:peptidoglycan/xylan/chitin deacetylase (PgdA/CDA1 family)
VHCPDLPGLPLMTMDQVRQWAARGVEIGGHTRTHLDLTAVPEAVVASEVIGSKADLVEAGLRPLSFAYPFGCFDEKVRESVAEFFRSRSPVKRV